MPASVVEAATELAAGGLVVIPTDTVYGLAAVPANAAAVGRVFEVKGRPRERALPILGASVDQLRGVAEMSGVVERLAAAFWPGGLTIVVARAPGFDHDLGGTERSSVAVRVPHHHVTRELLEQVGPLAVTSANRSGRPPPFTLDAARLALGAAVRVYVDGGRGAGAPSTILSLVGEPRILREGVVPSEDVLQTLTP